ncbi:MAG: hypothetical protein A3G41_04955 [Elusimicrobia bacterium RIFCSPLOWO2_12_FULL_59_9]|nr:MAG: hypothetical protein A3G41_04955 [Elusimicrobia bacterium RIFCSPLOWO2_12_FULL_59_9]
MDLFLCHRPFIGSGLDLIEKAIAGPAEPCGGVKVVEAGGRVGELIEDQQIVTPGNFCDKLSQKFNNIHFVQFGDTLSPN